MEKINLMINGLPGKVASNLLKHTGNTDEFFIVPASLTGPDTKEEFFSYKNKKIELIKPDQRDSKIENILKQYPEIIAIDYTHPLSVNSNCEFYCSKKIPFVMGTTGGDRQKLISDVENSPVSAVIAPNMAKQIVGFQAMMEYASKNFPGLFKGYSLEIKESHQSHKADTSGTAKAMVGYFNGLGLDFKIEEIKKERDPKKQKKDWNIPEAHLDGHAWHTYSLVSDDKTVKFEFTHNINGRDIYANGTLDAAKFLNKKLAQHIKSKAFNMIDVLKG